MMGERGRRGAAGLTATTILLAALILAGAPADAVHVALESPGSVPSGETADLTLNLTLETRDHHVPLTNFTARVGDLEATFDLSGTRLRGTDAITATPPNTTAPVGQGNATVVINATARNLTTDRYGYGSIGSTSTIAVTLSLDTSGLDPGDHAVSATVRGPGFSVDSPETTLTVTDPDTGTTGGGGGGSDDDGGSDSGGSTDSGSSSSGGGGGAGVGGGDDLADIYRRYTALALRPGEPRDVAFPTDSPVRRLTVTADTSSVFDPAFLVGVYDRRPDRVDQPPGRVWGYLSITTSVLEKNLRRVEIEFTVEREWLDAHGLSPDDIVLSRWHDKRWNDLDTRATETTPDTVTLRATSPGLSVFAIRAESPAPPTVTPPPGTGPDTSGGVPAAALRTPAPTPTPPTTPGFTALTALIGAAAALLVRREITR